MHKYSMLIVILCCTLGIITSGSEKLSTAPSSIADSLIAYYPLNGNANDASGHQNHGTVFGANLTNDRFNNPSRAYSFDAIDDYISKQAENINRYFTICGWLFVEDSTKDHFLYGERCFLGQSGIVNRHRIFIWRGSSNRDDIYQRDGKFIFQIITKAGFWDDNDKYTIQTTNRFNKSRWYFICAVRDNQNLRFYVDGVEQPVRSFSGNIDGTDATNLYDLRDAYNQEAYLGSCHHSTTLYGGGWIDDIRFYNRALSHEEIIELYQLKYYIAVTVPNGNEYWSCDSVYTIRWQDDFDENVAIDLFKEGAYHLPITSSTESDGAYDWHIPADLDSSSAYTIRIAHADSTDYFDTSDHPFTIAIVPDIVAFYPFTGNADDISSYANHGVVQGATLTHDRFYTNMGAYLFNGRDNWIEVPYNCILYPAELTISLWFYMQEIKDSMFLLRAGNSSTDQWKGWEMAKFDDNFIWRDYTGSYYNATLLYPAANLHTDEWYHVVITRSASEAKLYINNTLAASQEDLIPYAHPTTPLLIGRNEPDEPMTDCFTGKIDDIVMYNRILDDSEIDSLYHEKNWPVKQIKVIAPNGGEYYRMGTDMEIKWHDNFDGDVRISLYVDNHYTKPIVISTESDSSFNWTISDDSDISTSCRIRISHADSSHIYDESNNDFTIAPFPTLLAYYPFNGDARDSSGHGNHGTVFQATMAEDRFGNANSAYSFDAYNDYISKQAENINRSFTICGWLFVEDSTKDHFFYGERCFLGQSGIVNRHRIFIWRGSSNRDDIYQRDGKFIFQIITKAGFWDDNDKYTIQTTNRFNESRWYFICAVRENQRLRLYVDAVEQPVQPFSGNIDGTDATNLYDLRDAYNQEAYFGSCHHSTTLYGGGRLDDIYFYNGALTPEQISSLYHQGDWNIPKPKIESITYDPFQLNTPGLISAHISAECPIIKTALMYKKGGEETYQEAAQIDSSQIIQWQIPGNAVTETGIIFYIEIEDSAGNYTKTAPATVSVQIPENTMNLQFTGGSARTAYRMFSLPLLLNDASVDNILGDDLGSYDKKEWRLFRDEYGHYLEYPDCGDFKPGRAFWIISKKDATINIPSGQLAAASQFYTITVEPGWNQIGLPLNYPISWESILHANDQPPISGPYLYEGEYISPLPSILEPLKGYYVNNTINISIELYIPVDDEAAPSGKLAAAQECWRSRIGVSVQDAKDNLNILGCDPRAQDGYDCFDHLEPPPIGDYISLYFIQKGRQKEIHKNAIDIHQPSEEGYYWDFAVISNICNETVRLDFSEVVAADFPSDFEIFMLDSHLKLAYNLLQKSSYSYQSPESEREKSFRLLIGTASFIEEHNLGVSVTPTKFTLYQNFPNPFNSSTTIRYAVPNDCKVSLTIYDVLGKKVKTLLNKEQTKSGYYMRIWNGINEEGINVASGLYFYQLQTEKNIKVKKMIIVR